MKANQLFQLTVFSLIISSCGSTAQPVIPEYIQQDWAQDKLWDDGQAEVAIYDAERVVYGETRQFDYVYVLVKETFNKEFTVKTDDYGRSDLYPVMKVNKFCRIPTGNYPYHYLTSVFYKRENPALVHKLTNTSQEWCGNTAKSFVETGENYAFQYMSYWEGQGNGSANVKKGPWFEDQLSYTLRSLDFKDDLTFEVEIYPMQVSSKASVPQSEKATITVSEANANEIEELDSVFQQTSWKVDVSREAGSDLTYWFGKEYPNYLLKMESSDGRKLQLKSLERDSYWEHK